MNYVIGKSKILFLLCNSYFVIGTSLLNPRPKDPRDEIALAKPFALATDVALAKRLIIEDD